MIERALKITLIININYAN